MKTHLFHYFFLHSSAFQLTKIHIYANTRHLFPPLPHMGDGSQARINDIALAVMFCRISLAGISLISNKHSN